MPTITFAADDLNKLVGKKLDDKKLVYFLECAKAELDAKLSKELTVQFNDTNQPYLWSVEGLARFFRGMMGKHKGVPHIKVAKPQDKVIYDRRLSKIRPYIACFKATGKKIDDELLKQLIQLQEKLTENFGKKRQKISMGVYPLKSITFPVYCKAVSPNEKFTPLDFHQPITLKQTLAKHPKGQEYGHIIERERVYPVFMDAKREILSLIPIINSEHTGRLEPGDDSLFFDTTGTDEESVNLVANIFAYALAERGFTIHALTIEYPNKKVVTPSLKTKKMRFNEDDVKKILGITLKKNEIKQALNKMGYDYQGNTVTIPSYRNDIMHNVDIVEDVGIVYGYDRLVPLPLTSYTVGGTFPQRQILNTHRALWTGLGYQEVMSAILSSKERMYDKMNVKDFGTIEIENYISLTYSCVRTWILPLLLDVLGRNKHVDYPQRLFEQGLVSLNQKDARDEQHLAAVTAHSEATYTEMRQAIEAVFRNTGVTYSIEEFEMPCFIPGRAAQIIVDKKLIGFLGEIHPAVLEKYHIQVPVAGCDINLSALF